MPHRTRRFPLLRRREILLPTFWGWLLILGLLGGVCSVGAPILYRQLAVTDPVQTPDGVGARVLVIEGWLSEGELDQALAWYRQKHYQQVVTTGGPILYWSTGQRRNNYAERAADYLIEHGLTEVRALPAPPTTQDRTYLSAVTVREWARRSKLALDHIDLYSAGPHARRSRWVFELALGAGTQVGIVSAIPSEYDASHWWQSSIGAKTVMSEVVSLSWTACCFWPPAEGTRPAPAR